MESNEKHLKSVKFVDEYEWNEDINYFWKLKNNQELIGGAIECQFDSVKCENENVERFALHPVCKMIDKSSEFELGIKCLHFPDDVNGINVAWNLFDPQSKHAVYREFNLAKERNHQGVKFCINMMRDRKQFAFQIAIRILSVSSGH